MLSLRSMPAWLLRHGSYLRQLQKCSFQVGPLHVCPAGPRCKNARFSYGSCTRTLERGLTKSVNRKSPAGGQFPPISATKRPELHVCNRRPSPVHPNDITGGAAGIRPCAPPHQCGSPGAPAGMRALAGGYAGRPSGSHWLAALANRPIATALERSTTCCCNRYSDPVPHPRAARPAKGRVLLTPGGEMHDFAPGRPEFLADPLPRFCVPGLDWDLSTKCCQVGPKFSPDSRLFQL